MYTRKIFTLGSVCLSILAAATFIPGDARRGAMVFQSENCVNCHSVNGEGGKSAPDLARRVAREYTPAQMSALIWNHAPAMWTAIAGQGYRRPMLTEEQAADLFAYFYAARYMERPGDAARGKQVFETKRCAGCHGISSRVAGGGPPVAEWPSLDEPIALANAMWNHASEMRAAAQRKKVALPVLTSQELTDLLVYLQNLPQTRGRRADFSPASPETGEVLYKVKGCFHCHQGKLALDRFSGRTMTDFAAAMWDHAPKMGEKLPELNRQEMSRIVGYLWSIQFFGEKGDSGRGKRAFAAKGCNGCHGVSGSGAPNLSEAKGRYSATYMMAAVWRHGPAMLARMNAEKKPWPRFTGSEMADVIAYLNQ